MAQFPYPGVYVREVPSGVQAISGVSTSIAAFVAMAKAGPINLPTTVLGIQDYIRIFSDDTSQGEMTEQVQLFFLNGGEQAIITRIADGAVESRVDLVASDGATTVLSLRARDAGVLSNQLRVRVNYDTASPERSFNIEIFGEVFDASGQASVNRSETFENLSIDPESNRYVRTILDQQSQLVVANHDETATTTEEAAALGLATLNAFSASAQIFADAAAAETAIDTAIANTQAGGAGTSGSFRLRIEGPQASPTLTIVLAPGQTLAQIESAINDALAPSTTVTVAIPDPSNSPLRIQAVDALHDVVIESAAQFDIAGALGLGVAQGGIEVGAWANARPAPSGLVSVLDDGSGTLAALLALGAADRTTLDTIGVAGAAAVRPFTIATGDVAYPVPGTLFTDGSLSATASLANVVENLRALAVALSSGSPDWRAEVHGHRLALVPEFGSASSGAGATFTSATPNLAAAGQIFGGVTGATAAFPMGGGDDGSVAQLEDYQDAFQAIDENVGLFNIMLLPKSAGDLGSPSIRSSVWGPASAFCRDHRAVILVDAEPAQQTPQGVLAALPSLRTGVATDHAATYWPRVRITSGGVTKPVDPSGSVAGVMARIDGSRGVWKAAAGVEATIFAVRGVDVPMSDAQNGLLNPEAVNAVRAFPNGVLVWGARTMAGFDGSGQTDYRYFAVRRTALFIEESLRRGLQFAVFEPNDEPLWSQIRLAVRTFMNGLFRQNAFAGNTADAAFFVKCDAETTTPADQALGIVRVLVGFAPLRPAEFVVITLQQKTAQAQV
jgi:phage tail sheath protein FI